MREEYGELICCKGVGVWGGVLEIEYWIGIKSAVYKKWGYWRGEVKVRHHYSSGSS